MRTFKNIWLCALAVCTCVFASCSSDNDEPATTVSGQEMVQLIKQQVCVAGTEEIIFPKAGTTGNLYAAGVVDDQDAKVMNEALIHDSWDGQTRTIKLADDMGTIRISKGEKEGVYSTLNYNVKGIPSFTLEVTSIEYFENDNDIKPKYPNCKKCQKPMGWSEQATGKHKSCIII